MRARAAFALLPLLLASGCEEDKAEQAAEIAGEIRAEPDRAEEILDDHDMTIEEFEALMFEVASDPELSQRYQEELPPEAGDEPEEEPATEEE